MPFLLTGIELIALLLLSNRKAVGVNTTRFVNSVVKKTNIQIIDHLRSHFSCHPLISFGIILLLSLYCILLNICIRCLHLTDTQHGQNYWDTIIQTVDHK